MSDPIRTSLYASLIAQWSTLIFNFFGLGANLSLADEILRTVLKLETFVQIVELIFYTWYSTHIHRVAETTFYRYHDWAVTTPLMLFSTMIYYDYKNKPDKVVTLQSFLEEHWHNVLLVFGFNLIMLGFGYAYERGVLDLTTSTILGFVGFAGSFYIMWDSFASKSPENYALYGFMFVVWALYGFAALLNPKWKNVSYNLLDVVAKNFYGVFLSYLIYQKSISNKELATQELPHASPGSLEE